MAQQLNNNNCRERSSHRIIWEVKVHPMGNTSVGLCGIGPTTSFTCTVLFLSFPEYFLLVLQGAPSWPHLLRPPEVRRSAPPWCLHCILHTSQLQGSDYLTFDNLYLWTQLVLWHREQSRSSKQAHKSITIPTLTWMSWKMILQECITWE